MIEKSRTFKMHIPTQTINLTQSTQLTNYNKGAVNTNYRYSLPLKGL